MPLATGASRAPSLPALASASVVPTPQVLRVELRQALPTHFEVHFFNRSDEVLIIVRPSASEEFKEVPGLPGHTLLPPVSYKFEAVDLANGRTLRGLYSPMFPSNESANAAREKGRRPVIVESELSVPPHASAALSVDLPFALPAGSYALRFWYEYFQSSHLVPPHWYTGVAAAPPIAVFVKP